MKWLQKYQYDDVNTEQDVVKLAIDFTRFVYNVFQLHEHTL